jgi:hypothetical protein
MKARGGRAKGGGMMQGKTGKQVRQIEQSTPATLEVCPALSMLPLYQGSVSPVWVCARRSLRRELSPQSPIRFVMPLVARAFTAENVRMMRALKLYAERDAGPR